MESPDREVPLLQRFPCMESPDREVPIKHPLELSGSPTPVLGVMFYCLVLRLCRCGGRSPSLPISAQPHDFGRCCSLLFEV